MRDLVVILFLLTVFGQSAFATEYNNLLFFDGIGSKVIDGPSLSSGAMSNSNDLGLERQVDLFKSHYVTNGNANPKVIVAHSQGGVRALGFASKYPQYTKAVITVGSPVKGHSMLLNPQATKNKVNDALDTIKDGAAAVIPGLGDAAFGAVDLVLRASGFGDSLVDQIGTAVLKAKVTGDSANINSILAMALDPSTTKYPGLKDLSPNSDFIKKYISPKVDHTYKTVKVKTGYEWQWVKVGTITVNLGFTKIKQAVYSWSYEPVYEMKQVVTSTTVTKKIPDQVMVSFLRGTDNDPLSFLDASTRKKVKSGMNLYVDVTKTASDIETGIAAASAITAAACYATLNIPGGIAATAYAALFYDYSKRASAGSRWVDNYKSEVGKILGDKTNDSFIPYSAQAWDVNELGGNLMKLSHLDFVDNHVAERTDPAIWGVGGGLGKAITAEGGSVLARQMIEAGMNEPLDGKYQPAGYQTYGGMAR